MSRPGQDAEQPQRDARERILEACRQEIALRGVRGLRVQRVAKRAGVSLGLIYYHFTDHSGLLAATVDFINDTAQGRGHTAAGSLSGIEAVEKVLLSEFDDDATTRDGSVVWNEIRAMAVFEPDLQSALTSSTHHWEQSLEAALDQAGVPEADRPQTATLLTALVEGLSGRWLSGQISADQARSLMSAGLGSILGVARSR